MIELDTKVDRDELEVRKWRSVVATLLFILVLCSIVDILTK